MRLSILSLMFSAIIKSACHKLKGTCTGSLLENYLEFLEMSLSPSYLFGEKKRSYLHNNRYSTCTGSLLENYLEFLEMRLSTRNSENYLEFLELRLSISYVFGQNTNLPEQAQRHLYRQLVRK